MYIAMNRFRINAGREAEFEARWRDRDSYLEDQPGFVAFALLRNPNPLADGTTEFISHSTWRSQADFEAWRDSEAFRRGHAQGSVEGVIAGHPEVSFYDAVLTTSPKAKAGA
jgi:heme-degrading monooxygenase HmoA